MVRLEVHNPLEGNSSYQMKNISLAEPASSLFELPAGYNSADEVE
jgi:hypothetical protein